MMESMGRILVVDDNRMNRLKMTISLEQQGYAVGLAESGPEALEMLAAESFDVVLLDMIMPGMDGYEVLERIKSDPRMRDLPVIVISALDEVESIARCIEAGAEDFLPKSFDPVLLHARLNSCLQRKKLRDLERVYLQQEVALRQSEKLTTLGRLSAGLAHELNNPAAAAQRGASRLFGTFAKLQQTQLRLSGLDLDSDQINSLLAIDAKAQERARTPTHLDAMTRSDREYELETWLDDKSVENAWEVAPVLVNLGFDREALASLEDGFGAEHFVLVVDWLNCVAVIYSLLEEIRQGTGRISEIVKALKAYTYMDQAPVQNVDIHDGLESTLVILRSKLKQGVTIHREYADDLPHIEAYGSELNQVWTNLIDNAIDAMEGQGEITVRTKLEDDCIVVEIEDTGPGIPEDVVPHIFEPFFTTKPLGKGTGLGLNISHSIIEQKHHGSVVVYSEPGSTRFEVRLPLVQTTADSRSTA